MFWIVLMFGMHRLMFGMHRLKTFAVILMFELFPLIGMIFMI